MTGWYYSTMPRYVFQFLALLLLPVGLVYWKRHASTQSAPIRNGFNVVRWPLIVRLINVAFFLMMLVGCAFLLWANLATDEKVPAILWIIDIPLLVLSSYGPLSWRVCNEYNDTTMISFRLTGKSKQFAIADFTRADPVSWRGHEFSTETGDKIYVNAFETGGPALIDLLQRQAKETYYE
jgi:hypothetical protein